MLAESASRGLDRLQICQDGIVGLAKVNQFKAELRLKHDKWTFGRRKGTKKRLHIDTPLVWTNT